MSVKIIHVQEVLNVKIHLEAILVTTLTNVPLELITAAAKPAVKIQAGLLFANADRDIKVILNCRIIPYLSMIDNFRQWKRSTRM